MLVPSALFAYGLYAMGRELVERPKAASSRQRARARGRTSTPARGTSSELRARPASIAHPPVDLERGLSGLPAPDGEQPAPRRRKRRTRLAIALIVLGVVCAAYATAVVAWRDPLTDVYARWKQAEAEEALSATFAEFDGVADAAEPHVPRASRSYVVDPDAYAKAESERVAEAAEQMIARMRMGQPIGRIAIPKLGVDAVFVHGTRWGPDLSRGPGHYKETELPGVGRTAAIAAHRTTFGAWFRNIDDLRAGHPITITLPYATFRYEVFTRKIVDDEDWSIIEDRGFDTLVLSACHPLYSAAQRYVVFARVSSVKPRGGEAYAVKRNGRPVALDAA